MLMIIILQKTNNFLIFVRNLIYKPQVLKIKKITKRNLIQIQIIIRWFKKIKSKNKILEKRE